MDRTLLSPTGGGTVYLVNMFFENQRKIEELKASDGSESEGCNSDSDLDLLFDASAAVESNLHTESPDNDELQSPDQTHSKRPFDDGLFSPDAATSTNASNSKKLKGIKIEKP